MYKRVILVVFIFSASLCKAQYSFSGYVDTDVWQNNVYLSIVEDYRKFSGIYPEQIIFKTRADSTGFFHFSGNQLETASRIYKIHVDNCADERQDANHFNGFCKDSKEILFIANNNDSISFPFTFSNEMFCEIKSQNPKADAFIKIDSLKEDMKFAFGEYRSDANRRLNSAKWFKKLQDFGYQLDDPLAELYIYAFLSDRSSDLYSFYLTDLNTNTYYDELLYRLETTYPNSVYARQYKAELTSDKFMLSDGTGTKKFRWVYLVYLLLFFSLAFNGMLWHSLKKNKARAKASLTEQLTKQEQSILTLILDDKTNKEIAEKLFISLSTVKTHVNNIFKKLNVNSRDEIKALFSKQL